MKKLLQSLTDTGRIVRAFSFSLQGLRAAYRKESAFRQELILAAVLLPLAVWLGRTGVERSLLIGSVLLLLIVELLNSAVEATVDRAGKDSDTLAGRAKDIGSAAVLNALCTWSRPGLILFSRFGVELGRLGW